MSAATPARPLPEGLVVLDASFVIALLEAEPAAQRHAAVLARSLISSVTLGEVYVKLAATDVDPVAVHAGLLALGATLVDLPVAAAAHFPALRTIDAPRRTEQKVGGEKAATLSLADLAVLGHATHADLPVLTGDRHWATLTPPRSGRRRPPLPRPASRSMTCNSLRHPAPWSGRTWVG